jgi:NodT family efflux transporter outer membrane factor (OMF) lipoprotein
MTNLRHSFLLVSALFLAACAVGPDYRRPAVETPAAFKEAPEGWKPAEPQDAQARSKWWEVFGDGELNALIERVAAANQTLRASLANYNRAQALARQARAGFFPTLSAGASTNRGSSSVGTSQRSGGAITSDEVSLSAGWEPDLWGRVRRSVESEDATVAASRADMESTQLSLQAQVVQNYFQLRIADAQRVLLDEAVQAYTRSLELTRNRYKEGVVTRADVVQAQAQLAAAQAQWTEVDIARAQLEHAIATLIGVAPSALTIVAKPELARTVALPEVPGVLPSQLLERRPDIAGAERRIAAANAQIGVARAAWFPVLDLSGSFGYRSTRWTDLISAPNRLWSLGASLAETIFDGGARSASVDAAQASYDASVANYRQTVLSAFQEVEDNLATLRVLANEANYQQEAVSAARESLDLTINQYKAGTVSFLNVITAQATLLSNQQNELNLRSRQLVASAVLIRALGGGWQADATAGTGPAFAGR